MDKITERKKMVVAMEYIARHINDNTVFQTWLSCGVADGDIQNGSLDIEEVDDYYTDDDSFQELMDTFLTVMRHASAEGGLYCGKVVTKQG